jgi:DNA-binding NtrC family response regulator
MSDRRRYVLIVDDEPDVAMSVGELVAMEHEVRVVFGVREAIVEIAQRVPDVVVSDFDMPPFRGDALLHLVARECPQVRRILYTGSPPTMHEDLIDQGIAHAVLRKPSSAAELLEAICTDYDATE